MDLHEYELRMMSYEWLRTRFDLSWDDDDIFQLVRKTNKWQLMKSLPETSVDELRWFTRETYTAHKKDIINKNKETACRTKTLSEYMERLEYEFKVIDAMGYNTYFLIVQDYINRAKKNDIVVGPGRWSCAWSLLSYLIWITDIDPLKYDLIFERFLNPWRISMPDIDTDFEDTQRDKVIDYISGKYGKEKVAHIGTFGTMAAKAAFKDVARVFGVNFMDSNKYSALITEKTIEKSLAESEDFKNLYDNDTRIKKIVDIATRMEWTIRQTGVHACGMIIAPEDTINYSPIQYPPASGRKDSRDESRIVAQFDGHIVEDLGLLKMDMLGLKNLSIIKNTIKILKAKSKKEGEELSPILQEFLETMLLHPPLDDEKTYKIFHKGNTSWVFQFESDGMRQWLKKLKPTDFNDLIAMVALYRPWPMEYIPHYIDRKHEVEKIAYMEQELRRIVASRYDEQTADKEREKLHEDLTTFMDITYGIPVYQEQLMRIVQAMAWFSMVEADKLRKGVGKKIREVVEKIKGEFIGKAWKARDYKPETAQRIYEHMIEPAADYSFNKSHAACYAYISYQTAWLKANYPLEFHAALLRSSEEDNDRLAKLIDEIKLQWFTISLPKINDSFEHIAAVNGEILLWFLSIKGIGSDIAQFIEKERTENWAFDALTDFLMRCSPCINKKSLEALIQSWALDSFEGRSTLRKNINRILDRVKGKEKQASQWAWLFDIGTIEWANLELKKEEPFTLLETMQQEYNVFKTLLSSHPFDGMYNYLRSKYNFISMMKDVEGFGEFNILWMIKAINRGMKGGFFIQVEDISGEMEFFLSEKLDLHPFDIINIRWYKSRRFPSTDMILVYDLEEFQTKVKASWRFTEWETVAQVRKERFGGDKIKNSSPSPSQKGKNSVENTSIDVESKIIEQETWEENVWKQKPIQESNRTSKTNDTSTPSLSREGTGGWVNNTENSQSSFTTPDNILILSQIPQILKNHPGDITITIGDLETKVSEEGLETVRRLLG